MKKTFSILSAGVILLLTLAAGMSQNESKNKVMANEQLSTATLGAGCFWCVEAVFQQLEGVSKVTSGYCGGHVKNPSYKEVVRGNTGHAEAVQIQYDPRIIGFDQLLEVFWKTHDPTSLNRQGADIGTQYRSVIFYHDLQQKEIAQQSREKVDRSGYFNKPIVTEIAPFNNFFPAEDYHQDFYQNNPNQPYCRFNIDPKMEKLQQQFGRLLK